MKYKFFEPVVNMCEGDSYFLSNVNLSELYRNSPPQIISSSGTTFVGAEYDNHYLANIGWEKINSTNVGYKLFFSKENMDRISNEVSKKLFAEGHYIVVTPEVIGGVMSDVLRKHTPQVGDMYTRYIIPDDQPRNDISNLNNRVVNIIVSTIINEEDARKWNESLNIWDTVYGDFNRKGLRAHSTIRKRDNDYMKGQFNLNY